MIIDTQYKISAFGNFTDITPTPDNIRLFMELFKDSGLLPSLIQEVDVTGIQNLQQRISLVSSDNKEKIIIATNRIDYEIISLDDIKLSREKIEEYNTKIVQAFNLIFNEFHKNAIRLALNTQSLIINLTEDEIQQFLSKYSNPISVYNKNELEEWSTHLMTRNNVNIDNSTETLNIITNINKQLLHKNNQGTILQMQGFVIDVDINTIAENTNYRYNSKSIENFSDLAVNLWDKIINEVG